MTDFEQRLKDTLSNAYDIERELGGGGMSKVFVATDRSLGRKVVIKLLSPELTADVNRGRFRREIQVAAQLQHPHIVPLLSAGEHEELLYFTMPFITGESLRSAVEKSGPLSIADTVRVLYHVGEALDYAHGMGVVHRDIKPANILRSGNYSLVTDFGVAKALNAAMPSSAMTQTGMAIGTPAYMAPEQLAGDAAADHRIDIYALGLLAYELLNGRSPFAATTPQRILAAVLTQTPPPLIDVRPDVPQSLSDIVMACLSKEPDDRPATAKAVLAKLDSFSTASGEIRTMEHRIARVDRRTATPTPTTPTATRATPPGTRLNPIATPTTPTHAQPPVSMGELTPPDEVDAVEPEHSSGEVPAADQGVEYDRPKKGRSKLLLGVVALLVPIVAGALYMTQRDNGTPANVVAPPPVAVVDSAQVAPPVPAVAESAQVALPPAVKPESVAVVVPKVVDPKAKALADSIKKAARDAAAKKIAAKADSVRKAQETPLLRARRAAADFMANPAARAAFAKGATHKGGLLGAKNKGDLQTQIDALTPFLANASLSYEQFKGIVQASGVKLFDEFGRMVPDALQSFAR